MKCLLLAPTLALLLVSPVAAGELLSPGIYRVVETPSASAKPMTASTPTTKVTERFEHALPQRAGIDYAVVSHDAKAGMNKVLFIAGTDYPLASYSYSDRTPVADRLCVAYAFPGWNFFGDEQPFAALPSAMTKPCSSPWTMASFSAGPTSASGTGGNGYRRYARRRRRRPWSA